MDKYEYIGLNFVKKFIDPDAYAIGGFNAAAPDIISPRLNAIIEVKNYKAQAGQFVKSTIDKNPFSRAIAAKSREEVTSEEAKNWVREHYRQKGVGYFLIVNEDSTCTLYTFEDFFDNWDFKIELRSVKPSGSNPLAKKYWNQIPEDLLKIGLIDGFNESKKKVKICPDKTLWNYKYSFKVLYDDNTIRNAGVNANGMIYVKSTTRNETWIFQLDGRCK